MDGVTLPTSREETIGARLAQVAGRLGDRKAIVEEAAAVTYAELDAAATAIARSIPMAEHGRPRFVCLLFQHRTPAIKAIFGAARCGRAYVPLDADDPDERLRFILRDSDPIALLTEAGVRERARSLVASESCAVLDVEALNHDSGSSTALPCVGPDQLASLYYTSGSTGRPKGVQQTHRNLLFFADAYAATLGIGEADRATLLYAMSFSASSMDVFGGLLNGATLYACDVRRTGAASLADWLDHEQITVLHAVPSVYREAFRALAPGRRLERLRAIDLGGETVFASDVELFLAHTTKACKLVNHLAATEASVIAQHIVEHSSAEISRGVLPVGVCPHGLRVRVQRPDGSLAAAGEVGRIVISSVHVSPGYWRRPELDAVAFGADPDDPGARRYFTGDLGSVDDTGRLQFLGREGGRVKIRGHTVDLSEVEAALAACPGVAKAAVAMTRAEGNAESDRLTAYLVVEAGGERDPLLVRRRLAAKLPGYMLPAAFVFLDSLPPTATGKVDRQALAAIKAPTGDRERRLDPSRDELERGVAEVFEQVLKLGPIGRSEDFFMLGGDSLSVVELQTRLRGRFGAGLANPAEDASIAGVAAEIRRSRETSSGAPSPLPVLVPLRRQGAQPPMFLVHGRLGQAFVSPHFLDLLGADQPVWGFQARGLDGLHEPHATVEAMAADYLREMRKLRPHGLYFIAALCAGAYIAIAMARALREAGEAVLPLMLLDPPQQPLQRFDFRERALLKGLRAHKATGRIAPELDDPVYAAAAVRTAKAFEHALAQHRPQPYDGPVYMLGSRQRMSGAEATFLRSVFPGKLRRFEVGTTHDQALDPRSPVFAEYLERCLGLIRGSIKDPASGRSTDAAD
ncbi:MAG TPA: AMP-binding protein [Casimicrobiaceae bacterium]|nr:AMP-binding protein [Casimicrobiaceae bacterium]